MAKKGTRKERRQELSAVSLDAAHPHLWMQEIIQRVFVDGRNHPKGLCRCRKSSKSYFGMEECMERLFVDGGSHPKVRKTLSFFFIPGRYQYEVQRLIFAWFPVGIHQCWPVIEF